MTGNNTFANVSNEETDNSLTEHLLDAIIIITIATLSLAGNLAVVMMLWFNERFRNAVNGILASISFSDLIYTIFVLPFTFLYVGDVSSFTGYGVWYMTSFFSNFCRNLSSLSLTFLVVDRYLSLKDLSRSTSSRCILWFSIGSFFVASTTTMLSCLGSKNRTTHLTSDKDPWNRVFGVLLFSPTGNISVIMAYAACRFIVICLILGSWVKIVFILCGNVSRKFSVTSDDYRFRIAPETERAITVLILAATHIACQLPLCFNELLVHKFPNDDGSFNVNPLIVLFSWSNMMINPLIYIYRNKAFRQMLQIGLGHKCCDTFRFEKRVTGHIGRGNIGPNEDNIRCVIQLPGFDFKGFNSIDAENETTEIMTL